MHSSEDNHIKYFKKYLKKTFSHVTKINMLEEEDEFDEISRMNLTQNDEQITDVPYDSATDLIRHLTSLISGSSQTQRNIYSEQPNIPEINHLNSSTYLQPRDTDRNSIDTNNIYATIITERMSVNSNNNRTTLLHRYQVPISGDLGRYLSTLFGGLISNFRASDPNDVILPLTDEAFKQLEEKKFSEFNEQNKSDTCTICQEKFESDTIIKILPCKHIFHIECIGEWLKNYHHKCPICRTDSGNYVARV